MGNANAHDLIDRDVVELGEDYLQDVGIHGDCDRTVRAIPHTEREPHIFHKFPEGHAWSLGFRLFDIRHVFFLLSLPLGLRFRSGRGSQLHFTQNRHPFRFLPTFGGSHSSGRLPCFTTKNLLAIVISAKENLDLEGINLAIFEFFLNLCRFVAPFPQQKLEQWQCFFGIC